MSTPRLHVPAVPARPGEQPDFSYIRLSPAGAVARPPVDVAVHETAGLAEAQYELAQQCVPPH